MQVQGDVRAEVLNIRRLTACLSTRPLVQHLGTNSHPARKGAGGEGGSEEGSQGNGHRVGHHRQIHYQEEGRRERPDFWKVRRVGKLQSNRRMRELSCANWRVSLIFDLVSMFTA